MSNLFTNNWYVLPLLSDLANLKLNLNNDWHQTKLWAKQNSKMLLEVRKHIWHADSVWKKYQQIPLWRVTISRIRDKFEANRMVQNVHKQRLGRPRSLTYPTNEKKKLIETLTRLS